MRNILVSSLNFFCAICSADRSQLQSEVEVLRESEARLQLTVTENRAEIKRLVDDKADLARKLADVEQTLAEVSSVSSRQLYFANCVSYHLLLFCCGLRI